MDRETHSDRAARVAHDLRARQLDIAEKLAVFGVWEWHIDADRFEWSDGLRRIFGGPDVPCLSLADYLERVHPDDRERVRRVVLDGLVSGAPLDFEERIMRPDGDLRTLRSRAELVRDEEGRPVRLTGVCQDITVQKAAQAQALELLREQLARRRTEDERRRLANLLEQAPAAIAVTYGPTHLVTLSNAVHRRLAGSRDYLGRPLRDGFPELHEQGVTATYDRVFQSGEPFVGRALPLRFDAPGDAPRRPTWFDLAYQPVRDDGDRVIGVLAHLVDVTDVVMARIEMERAVRLRDEVLSIVSHDLRSPLAVISMAADAIEREAGQLAARHLRLVRRARDEMRRLIGDLLDVARIEAGAMRIDARPTSPAAVLEETCESLRVRVEERRLTLDVHLPPRDVLVLADPDRVRQVLTNLIDNGLKFTDRGGLTVAAEVEDGVVRVSVTDTGAGISTEDQLHLFDRFWRAEDTRRREGTGLGLTIVKGMVEAHGGQVGLDSAPGRGTTVWFTLPRAGAGPEG